MKAPFLKFKGCDLKLNSISLLKTAALLVFVTIINGCTTAPVKQSPSSTSTAAKSGGYYLDDGPDDNPPPNLEQTPDATPKNEPYHRFANRPYAVLGTTYAPELNDNPYKERGRASWYGKKFKGKKTASGEPYNMYAMTAAHRTLPLPSYVRVTNINNDRSVIVRVNDRGPFHSSRIIDLSYTAALKLGLIGKGSGMVEVERVFANVTPTPEAPVNNIALLNNTKAVADNNVETASQSVFAIPSLRGHFLQLGAFGMKERAEQLQFEIKQKLSWLLEPTQIMLKEGLYRVWLGPYPTKTEALAIADKIKVTFDLTSFIRPLQERKTGI